MTRIIDQTLAVQIGKKDGVVVLDVKRMLLLVEGDDMFLMMMVSPCINLSFLFLLLNNTIFLSLNSFISICFP